MRATELIPLALLSMVACSAFGETIISTNRQAVGLETNSLFNATNRFTVTQSGPAPVNLELLFDGNFMPSYSMGTPTFADPQVILIEDLPGRHAQQGAWVGFTARVWQPTYFKVEAYGVYGGLNQWILVADHSGTPDGSGHFFVKVPSQAYTKLRFTIYESAASGSHGKFGLSEIFFLHPEAGRIYEGLLPSNLWQVGGNVGLGTKTPEHALSVNGTLQAKEVIVETGWADYVFEEGYYLKTLGEVEAHIGEYGHLPGVPSSAVVRKEGISVGESQKLLMQKVEELTLYAIEQEKEISHLKKENSKLVELETENVSLGKRLARLESLVSSSEASSSN